MLKGLYRFTIFYAPNRGTATISPNYYLLSFESEYDRNNIVTVALVFGHGDALGIPLLTRQGNPIDAVEEIGSTHERSIWR